ncbi:hypothetical protein GUITHDRAFT_106510 [Guillardia theta CCMP2712]|uniref:Mediator of RNA polymerase II transcription subunit 20 n=1 Tax=Guillardia theta (strain CCMP2712) TaxID=905079 RepID=L1JG77_GUITC|nr:hypothetical protein GUITHDRAFT_106510 [Guillardia theta CCMP2712]EKX47523.1 hypothetical protein GUITHDRAFT_106510 [Guillardia theta CCMP2712]|eukprot:XP_005834503.1 hypothetical protein GUITHDRAFT_106510 [Guillardia theta CCMP2712]
MGAKWLFQLRSAPGQQTSTLHLFDRFETLGAKKLNKWKTQTTLYRRPTPGGDKVAGDVFLVNFLSDTPDKVYMIIRQGEEDKVMEAGSSFMQIWSMINATSTGGGPALYEQKSSMTVEGWAYDMGDFVMRVGSVVIRSQAQNRPEERAGRSDAFKGAVLEVEYVPSADRGDCSQLINEFVYCQPDGPTAVAVTGFRPVTNVIATKGIGGMASLHWQTRTKEYTNEHRAQQYVQLYHAVNRSSGDGGTGSSTAQAATTSSATASTTTTSATPATSSLPGTSASNAPTPAVIGHFPVKK